MKKIIPILLFLLGSNQLFAQNKYAVSNIPQALFNKANAIVRIDEMKVKIENIGKATVTHHFAYTLLNKGAEDMMEMVFDYDKFRELHHIEGTLYNSEGKKIRSMKKADLIDHSATGSSELADDTRLKYHNFSYQDYPFTIEYETEMELNGIFYLPQWNVVPDEFCAVEQSSLLVKCPANYQLRYKTFNIPQAPVVNTEKNTTSYSWQINQYPAIKMEPLTAGWREIVPYIYLAPTQFEIQHYTGEMNNWQNYGKFIYQLNADRDQLPEAIRNKVHELTDGIQDTKTKVKQLYQYLQQNTRYISVQLGIGGWQTFDANYVASNGYGDCKALSNYMYSLLKEAGIKSNWVLIRSGRGSMPIISDFPSTQFNHMILCVPQPKDSIWLECTSQTDQAGYLGESTSDRDALLIDETGGKLVHTPVYKKEDNLQARRVTGTIDENGQLSAVINTTYFAEQQDQLDMQLNYYNKERITEMLREKLDLPSYELVDYQFSRPPGSLPSLHEHLTITAPNYAAITGKRLFVTPNLLNKSSSRLLHPEERKYEIVLKASFTDRDTVELTIPNGYQPESVPTDVVIESPFGNYRSETKVKGDKIIYIRFYQREKSRLPPAKAKELAEFFEKIYKSDRSKIVFVKNTP